MPIYPKLNLKYRSVMSTQLCFSATFSAVIGALLLPFSMTANAAPFKNLPRDQNATLSVGANVMYSSNAYDTDGSDLKVLPGIFYDNNKVYARGNQAGAYIINDRNNQLDAFARLSGPNFDPDEANGALKGLDEREWTALAGLSYQRRTPIGGFRAQVATDALGRSDGTTARLTYLSRYSKDALTVYPSIGLEWQDQNYNEYYYGVSDEESAKTGIQAYKPDQSIHPYVSVSANYDFNEQWAGFASQSIAYLSDEQYDSPMVDSHTEATTTLGLLYKF